VEYPVVISNDARTIIQRDVPLPLLIWKLRILRTNVAMNDADLLALASNVNEK
jgi:hypothetical protein